MVGKDMLYKLRLLLNELADSPFFDTLTAYQALNEAACQFVSRTNALKNEATITTVADQAGYQLPLDFLLPWTTRNNEHYLRYYDGSTYNNIFMKDQDDIFYENNTTSVTIPSGWCLCDCPLTPTIRTGTATANGTSNGGEVTLTNSAADFSDSGWSVQAGDYIHNITDGSVGMVIEYTDATHLICALFNGTNNDFTSGDSYGISGAGRLKISLDPPPSESGHIITFPYVQKPTVVYSDFRSFRLQQRYIEALINFAAAIFAKRDRDVNKTQLFSQIFNSGIVQGINQINKTHGKKRHFTMSGKN